MKYYLGIDIGGATIKAMCITVRGRVLSEANCPTESQRGGIAVCDNIAALCEKVRSGIEGELSGVGVGCPGMINAQTGTVKFAGNLNLRDFPLGEELKKRLGTEVRMTNDANAAALGEARFGAGKHHKNSILVTLGTGVGGGIILNGKLFEGNMSAGAEIGHMVIETNGDKCTCGRRGCFEVYSSATALMRRTRNAMEAAKNSAMWGKYTSRDCTGRTAFDFMESDAAAKEVVDWYIKYLGCGLVNLANIFRPEVIMLGGGVAAQGEKLTKPLQEIMDKKIFGGNDYARVEVVTASLGNKAGCLGAAALAMNK